MCFFSQPLNVQFLSASVKIFFLLSWPLLSAANQISETYILAKMLELDS